MGYQALLFCPDEKLARVVSQVFTELDFTVEPVHEPFAAVKKLMAQRFDAIVVDCDNEQNASLLFKSARNSSSNQSSLAIAVVEGQAGVAKAYRIGANLVLTKPINVEQAKGTLRVARGLLRKNSDAAGASAPSTATPATPVKTPAAANNSSIQPVNRSTPPSAAPSRPSELPIDSRAIGSPEFDTPEFNAPLQTAPPAVLPSMAALAKIEDKPAFAPTPTAKAEITTASEHATETRPPAFSSAIKRNVHSDIVKNSDTIRTAPKGDAAADLFVAPVTAQNTSSAFTSASGSAAAPAPAKEVTAPPAKENKAVEFEPANSSHSGPTFGSLNTSDAPSFGALNEEDSDGSGGKKKIFIGIAAVAALAVIAYFGYGMLGKSGASAPVPKSVSSTPQSPASSSSALTSAPAPIASPSTSPSTSASSLTSSATPQAASAVKGSTTPLADKPSASAGSPPSIRIDASPVPATQKPASAPIQVKSNGGTARKPAQGQADDSAPALPSALAAASTNDSSLSGLMAADSNVAKPTLATVRISQGVSQGLLIKRVQPKYPQAALAVHAQGAVQIEATINKEGTVTNVKVLSGDPVLARAAVEAVRQWRYKPYYLDGDPVEIQTQITVNFKAN